MMLNQIKHPNNNFFVTPAKTPMTRRRKPRLVMVVRHSLKTCESILAGSGERRIHCSIWTCEKKHFHVTSPTGLLQLYRQAPKELFLQMAAKCAYVPHIHTGPCRVAWRQRQSQEPVRAHAWCAYFSAHFNVLETRHLGLICVGKIPSL